MYLNRVQIIGYLGRNAEMKFTPNGTAVTRLSIATKEGFKKDGKFEQRTEWHSVQVFGDLAKYAERFRKGQNVDVIGHFRSREYAGKGGKVRTFEIVAETVAEFRPGASVIATPSGERP